MTRTVMATRVTEFWFLAMSNNHFVDVSIQQTKCFDISIYTSIYGKINFSISELFGGWKTFEASNGRNDDVCRVD